MWVSRWCSRGRYRGEYHDNGVSGFDLFHFGPNSFDHSRALVPVYGRIWDREIPVPGVDVRLANPARRDADQHLASLRPGKLYPFDMEEPASLMNDGCGDLQGQRSMAGFIHRISLEVISVTFKHTVGLF